MNAVDRRHWVCSWGAFVGAAAGGAAVATWGLYLRGRWPTDAPSSFAVTATLGGVFLWFGAFTWRRLGRLGARERSAVVADYGVRGFGVAMGVAGTLWFGLKDAAPLSVASLASGEVWFRLTLGAMIYAPLGLWAGYAWGRAMGAVFVIRKDR